MKSTLYTAHLELRRKEFSELKDKKSIFSYDSPFYYDLKITQEPEETGWVLKLRKTQFNPPFKKYKKELIADSYKTQAQFYFVYQKNNSEYIGWICFEQITWNNTLRVWDINVESSFRHLGYGSELMEFIKEQAKKVGSRAIVLECQTSNYYAIQFYRKMGFELGGFDSISYSNNDIERHEVRLEMIWKNHQHE